MTCWWGIPGFFWLFHEFQYLREQIHDLLDFGPLKFNRQKLLVFQFTLNRGFE